MKKVAAVLVVMAVYLSGSVVLFHWALAAPWPRGAAAIPIVFMLAAGAERWALWFGSRLN